MRLALFWEAVISIAPLSCGSMLMVWFAMRALTSFWSTLTDSRRPLSNDKYVFGAGVGVGASGVGVGAFGTGSLIKWKIICGSSVKFCSVAVTLTGQRL